jgi:hypothetical protein
MTEPTLEQLVNGVANLASAGTGVDRAIADFRKDNTDRKALARYAQFTDIEQDPDTLKQFVSALASYSPADVRAKMESTRGRYDSELVGLLGANMDALLASNDPLLLGSMAYGISGNYAAIEELKELFAARDTDKIRKTLVQKTPFGKSKDWVELITKFPNDAIILGLTGKFIETQREHFMKQFYAKRTGADGKEETYMDVAKISGYIRDTLGKLEDKYKPSALIYAGRAFYAAIEEVKAAEEKAKAKSK